MTPTVYQRCLSGLSALFSAFQYDLPSCEPSIRTCVLITPYTLNIFSVHVMMTVIFKSHHRAPHDLQWGLLAGGTEA